MATDETVTVPEAAACRRRRARDLLGFLVGDRADVIVLGLVARVAVPGRPSLSAPTRDPAWYTWRAQVILDCEPQPGRPGMGSARTVLGRVSRERALDGRLAAAGRGIDRYTFSTLFMIAIPLLAGLALGAAFFRSRRNPLVIHMAMLAAVAMFLSTPYVGYLDNSTVLFLLSLMIPFRMPPERRGAREPRCS